MSHLIILYNRLRLNARAVAFGLLATLLSIALYSAFLICAYLLGSLPVDLWHHSEQPLWAAIESVYRRVAIVFAQGEEADSFAHFPDVLASWLSLVAGAALARKRTNSQVAINCPHAASSHSRLGQTHCRHLPSPLRS